MIICLGPVCVPIWPVLALLLKPLFEALPQSTQDSLTAFFDEKIFPTCINPWYSRIPPKLRGFLFYGCKKRKGTGTKDSAPDGNSPDGESVKQNGENTGTELRQRKGAGNNNSSDTNGTTSSATLPTGSVVILESAEEFQKLVKAPKGAYNAIYLDFTATWCKPCQKLKPIFAELAEKNQDSLFCLVDADDLEEVAEEFEVASLPQIVKLENKGANAKYVESGRLQMCTEEKLRGFVAE